MTESDHIEFAGADEESADSESTVLYLAALKEVEKEEGISLLEGVRRVEMARSRR